MQYIKHRLNSKAHFNLSKPMRISDLFFSPTLASLMEKRREALFLGGVAATQFALVTVGLPGWPCPFKAAFGIPCPACGMSTSISYLLHGDWHGAFATHAFAPFFFVGLLSMIAISLLPEPMRRSIIQQIATVEKRTGVTMLFITSLMIYWGFRLLQV
jgi:hypothetical protein